MALKSSSYCASISGIIIIIIITRLAANTARRQQPHRRTANIFTQESPNITPVTVTRYWLSFTSLNSDDVTRRSHDCHLYHNCATGVRRLQASACFSYSCLIYAWTLQYVIYYFVDRLGAFFSRTRFIWQQCTIRQCHSDLSDQSALRSLRTHVECIEKKMMECRGCLWKDFCKPF